MASTPEVVDVATEQFAAGLIEGREAAASTAGGPPRDGPLITDSCSTSPAPCAQPLVVPPFDSPRRRAVRAQGKPTNRASYAQPLVVPQLAHL